MTNTIRTIPKDEVISEITSLSQQTSVNRAKVAAIMGPNGSGKTRLLYEISTRFRSSGHRTLHITAFRNAQNLLHSSAGIGPTNMQNVLGDFKSVGEAVSFIIDRLFQQDFTSPPSPSYRSPADAMITYDVALGLLINAVLKYDDNIDRENGVSITRWNKHGRDKGEPMPDNQPLLWPDLLELINSVLDYAFYLEDSTLQPSTPSKEVRYKVNGVELRLSNLSDGEKQIMIMGILLLSSIEENFVVIVDEPELHLNEQRAIDVWSKAEEKLKNCLFVYATHNVAFATRSDVERLYFTRLNGEIEWMDLDSPLPAYALKEIVGSRVQLLRTDKPVIFCEDDLSLNMLSDMFVGENFSVVSVGGKDGVIRGSRPEDIWNKLIAGDRICCGVVDRDARQDDQVIRVEEKKSFCLPVNEIESLLLHPDIILPLVKAVDPKTTLTRENYAKIVCSSAHSAIKDSLKTLQGYIVDMTRVKIISKQTENGIEVVGLEGPDEIKSNFTAYANTLLDAIKNEDLDTVLILSCGKEVFQRVARDSVSKIGFAIDPDPIRFYNMIRDKPIVIEKLQSIFGLNELKDKVRAALS